MSAARVFAAVLVFCLFAPLPAAAAEAAQTSTAPSRIEGVVLGPDGAPLAGAKVYALALKESVNEDRERMVRERGLLSAPAGEAKPKAKLQTATTGGDGRFAFEGSGTYGVRAEYPGLAPVDRDDVRAGAPASLKLAPGVGVEGDAFEAGSNRPAAGATAAANATGFRLWDPDVPDRFVPKAKSDAKGHFRIADLAPGDYWVSVSAEGKRSTALQVRAGGPPPANPFVYYLRPGSSLSGKVVSKGGQPVAGARVSAIPGELFGFVDAIRTNLTATTGPGGEFEIQGIAPGTWTASARHDDYADAWVKNIRAPEGRRAPKVAITLDKGGALTAKLSVADQPFEGKASVNLHYEPEQLGVGSVTREAEVKGGVLTVDRLPAGSPRATVRATGYKSTPAQAVTIRTGDRTDLGSIALERGAAIAGKVVGADGRGVEGVPVSARSMAMTGFGGGDATTTADGAFVIPGLVADRAYTVTAAKKGAGSARQADVKPDSGTLAITLQAGGTIHGRALAGDPPAPLANYTVSATAASQAGDMEAVQRAAAGLDRATSVRDTSGEFRVSDLEPGTYSVKVNAPGFVPGRVEGLELKSGSTVESGDIVLVPGSKMRVIVVDKKTKTPLGGTEVGPVEGGMFGMMRDVNPLREPGMTTGPDGQIVLDGLAPGRITVRAEHENYAPARVDIDIAKDAPPPDTTIELSTGGSIEGIVRDKQGQLRHGFMVMAMSGMAMSRRTMQTSDEMGHFKMEHLAPGSYMVMTMPAPVQDSDAPSGQAVSDMMGQMQMQTVTVEENRVARADFPTGGVQGSVRVHGRVLKGKTPVEATMFWAKTTTAGAPTDVGTASTNPDGSFEIRLNSSGRYQVRVQPKTEEYDPSQIGFSVNVELPEKPDVEQDIVQPKGAFAGTVIDGDSGQPLKGAMVMALRVNENAEVDPTDPVGSSAVTGTDGSYTMEGLRDGTYTVASSLARYGVEISPAIELKGEKPVPYSAQLRRAIPLKVRVRDDNDQPVQGAVVLPVKNFYAVAGRMMETMTDADGRIVIEQLGIGTHDLAAMAAGYAPAILRDVDPAAGKGEPVEFTLQRGGAVRLRVLDSGGQGIAGAGVRVRPEGGADITPLVQMVKVFSGKGFFLATDAGGAVTLDALEPGSYDIQIIRGDEVVAHRTVKVRGGGTEEVEIKLP